MNLRVLPAICVALLSGVWALSSAATRPVSPSLIPLPVQLIRMDGRFRVDAHTPLVLGDKSAWTRHTASWLANLAGRTRGLRLEVYAAGRTTSRPVIRLALDPDAPVTQHGGYALEVTPQGISLRARDEAGLFHGAATLQQLLTPDARRGAVSIPALSIRDWPRFTWRGLMLDSARHFQGVADIKKLIDQMAQHKLNVLHWHLTDDQGWRIQIRRYPELTRTGAWRRPPSAGHDGEPKRYGGFYTQAQIRKVVAYAAARKITVVPELDMPGHAQAAVASYPQIGVTGKRPLVSVDWGVNPYLYNVNDATFDFIDNVLDEVMALFPSTCIHVGGDEAIKDQWKASAAVQAKMHALGITSEDALQGWFIGRIGHYLKQHHRRLIGWDEIMEGNNLPDAATVMSWRGTKGAIRAASHGLDVIMTPSPTLYLDHVQGSLPDEYAGRLGVETLKDIYDMPVVPPALDPTLVRHVLGVQGNVWTEHATTMAHVEHMIFPRLDALAEIAWLPSDRLNYRDFIARLPAQLERYATQRVGYADSIFAVAIDVDRNAALKTGRTRVTLSSQAGLGSIHYTLDGTVPTPASPRYTAQLNLKLPVNVRAASFTDAGLKLAATRQRRIDRATMRSLLGNLLPDCPGSDFRLRVQPMPDATSVQPVYAVNVFDSCQLFPATLMDTVTAIHVDTVRLVRNYALAHEAKLVISRPHTTRFGELVVHADRCDGKVLATMPLPDPGRAPRQFTLDASLPVQTGRHLLCLIYTAPINGPLYALGRVSLKTAH